MKKNIELEFRSRFDEATYVKIRDHLNANAFDEGDDSKDTYFFIWEDKFAKVVYNKHKRSAKASMKIGRVGQVASFREIEFPIDISSIDEVKALFEVFSPNDVQYVFQFRRNYQYKGVSLALKYTESWGFHLEFERMISSVDQRAAEEKIIRRLANELDCTLMTDSELKTYTSEIDSGIKYGQYSQVDFPYINDYEG